MASEIRVNQIQSRTGVSTISFTDTGPNYNATRGGNGSGGIVIISYPT